MLAGKNNAGKKEDCLELLQSIQSSRK